MAKIKNDKYYTSLELAKYTVNKTHEIIGKENIIEYIEPSAGSGVFLDVFDKMNIHNYKAYDIEPEDNKNRIVKQNYLDLELNYKKGRCIIGNPPFGSRMNLAVQFYKKSIQIADYIAFILPISQYNNNQQMYEFDLICSDNLGFQQYSNKKLMCCFNIYKRNLNGLNKKPNYKLKDVEVKEYRRNGSYKKPINYDFSMCSWGASLGKEINFIGQYAQENYIIIHNLKYKNKILNIMKHTDWKNLYPYIATPKIQTWKIYKYLKEQIPELK